MKKIDWSKKGQIVKVGWASNFQSITGRFSIEVFADEHGNTFGANEKPKFNPFTGKKIETINYTLAEDYDCDVGFYYECLMDEKKGKVLS